MSKYSNECNEMVITGLSICCNRAFPTIHSLEIGNDAVLAGFRRYIVFSISLEAGYIGGGNLQSMTRMRGYLVFQVS